jgi:hypothetical protein
MRYFVVLSHEIPLFSTTRVSSAFDSNSRNSYRASIVKLDVIWYNLRMKRFWAFYGLMPVLLLTIVVPLGFGTSIAAAPGSVRTEKFVYFDIPADAPDPNKTLSLVNQQRELFGVPPLTPDERLGEVAKARANDMVKRQYYAHKSPDGKYYYDYFDSYGVVDSYSCENLDLVFVPSQESVINEWMASLRGHRGCLVNAKTTHAGYAAAKLTLVDFYGEHTEAYLIVAIHAQQ